jgi:hypothetical protein
MNNQMSYQMKNQMNLPQRPSTRCFDTDHHNIQSNIHNCVSHRNVQ